jgi:hypothetical protein
VRNRANAAANAANVLPTARSDWLGSLGDGVRNRQRAELYIRQQETKSLNARLPA